MADVQAILAELENGPSELNFHIRTLYRFAKQSCRPLELGVLSGNSTLAMMCACVEDQKRLCSCDINYCEKMVRTRMRRSGLDDHWWAFVHGDDRSPETLASICRINRTFDLIFIDTSHEREHTTLELVMYYPLLERGGVMVFHDTHTDLYAGGVFEPLMSFLHRHTDCRLIYDSTEAYGLTAFART